MTGFIVKPESCLEQEIERCDAILLVKSNFKLDVAEVYLPVIQKAGQLGKKVMCNFTLPDPCMEFIELCEEQDDKLILKIHLMYARRIFYRLTRALLFMIFYTGSVCIRVERANA